MKTSGSGPAVYPGAGSLDERHRAQERSLGSLQSPQVRQQHSSPKPGAPPMSPGSQHKRKWGARNPRVPSATPSPSHLPFPGAAPEGLPAVYPWYPPQQGGPGEGHSREKQGQEEEEHKGRDVHAKHRGQEGYTSGASRAEPSEQQQEDRAGRGQHPLQGGGELERRDEQARGGGNAPLEGSHSEQHGQEKQWQKGQKQQWQWQQGPMGTLSGVPEQGQAAPYSSAPQLSQGLQFMGSFGKSKRDLLEGKAGSIREALGWGPMGKYPK